MSEINELMWVEKYRPQKLDQLVSQSSIVEKLLLMINDPRNLPHMMFSGPPGTGKTTSALCIAKTILGEYWRDFTLELNASDERGINTVRDRVKLFARYSDKRVEIPFRLIILDEAGQLAIVNANPNSFEVLAQAQVLTSRSWTVPTLSGTKLYLRDMKEILALDLSP